MEAAGERSGAAERSFKANDPRGVTKGCSQKKGEGGSGRCCSRVEERQVEMRLVDCHFESTGCSGVLDSSCWFCDSSPQLLNGVEESASSESSDVGNTVPVAGTL